MTMAKLIPNFAKSQVSLLPLPFCSYPNNTCCVLAKLLFPSNVTQCSYLRASSSAFCGVWSLSRPSVLKVLSSEWLCAIPLSPFEVFCTFPASAGPSQCSAPMSMQNTSSQISSGVQVSPGQMVLGGRSLPPSSTLESFGGCE